MIKKTWLIFLLLITIPAYNIKATVIIKAKISGKIPEKIFYTSGEQGYCFWGFVQSVQPSIFGTFKIKLKLKEKTGFVKIWISGKEYTLIVEKDGEYEISCIVDAKKQNFKFIKGNLPELQKFYNSLPNPVHINQSVYEFSKDTTVRAIIKHIKQAKNEQIAYLQQLFSESKISKSVFELVKNDRKCYYATVQGTIALLKMYKIYENHESFPKKYYQMWKNAFTNFDTGKVIYKQSPWYYNYLENYLFFKEYTADDFSVDTLMKIYNDNLIHTHSINIAKQYLAKEQLNFYIPVYLYIAALQKQYEKELIGLFNQLKKEFPRNPFTKYSQPLIEDIKRYYFNDKKIDTDIRIINNYNKINSLTECLNIFKGYKVYVDVWASWCSECIDEFKHYGQVINYLQEKNIKILYISTDENKNDLKWRSLMLYYKLKGYHIRTNKQFLKDLRKIYNQNNILILPWHILIDENGNIIDKNLPLPANFEKFIKAIEQ